MVLVSLEASLIALIVGIILIVLARSVQIEATINKLMYVFGIILAVIGLILLLIYIMFLVL